MDKLSSYLRYLPPVLWSREGDPQQFLGRMLRIFEKLLTGIDDGVALARGDGEDQPFEQIIDALPWLFDAWRTPTAQLPRLAMAVGLALEQGWSEYQQRRMIAAAVAIGQQRGLKQGLLAYLDAYSAPHGQPRIVVDEGEAIFRAHLDDDGMAHVVAIAHTHTVVVGNKSVTPLLSPVALVVERDGAIVVLDQGDSSFDIVPSLWRLSASGEVAYHSTPATAAPLPQPLYSGAPLNSPEAIALDAQGDCYLADSDIARSSATIYRLETSPAGNKLTPIISTQTRPGWAVRPLDMTFDSVGKLVVLDRGLHTSGDPPFGPAQPRIVVIGLNPLSVEERPLPNIVEPTALAIDSQGRWIVADAGSQDSTGPASLVRIDPQNGWAQTLLLADVAPERNPLLFPTGLAFESPHSLLVSDTGVRWGYSDDPTERTVAEPPAIYRVDLTQVPPVISRVTSDRRLVSPTRMAFDQDGALLVADRGEAIRSGYLHSWRIGAHEFGVVVLFSQQRHTPIGQRNQLRQAIGRIIAEQCPAHTMGWIDF
jgi:phage tail-like protein